VYSLYYEWSPVLTLLFWGLVVLDACGIALWFMLGLAAAGSTKDSPLSVAFALVLLPAIPLALAVFLFLRGGSTVTRAIAVLMAAAPLLIAVSMSAINEARLDAHRNAQGTLTFFKAGPQREIAEAIARNDAATVSALLPQVKVNEAGFEGTTLLIAALRQLRTTPDRLEVLRVITAAGADPNIGTQYEQPLSIALQVAGKAGAEPVRLLLEAGADPNRLDTFGTPAWFTATGQSASPELLAMLLARGADVRAKSRDGRTALFWAATTRNWQAALTLLEHGADWRTGTSATGLPFTVVVERELESQSDAPGFAEVRAFVARR
jgi:hypothetical protein